MSRRHLSLLVVALASLIVSACGTASTAPRRDDSTAVAPPTIVTSGSYDVIVTDSTGRIVTSGSY